MNPFPFSVFTDGKDGKALRWRVEITSTVSARICHYASQAADEDAQNRISFANCATFFHIAVNGLLTEGRYISLHEQFFGETFGEEKNSIVLTLHSLYFLRQPQQGLIGQTSE